MRGEDEEKKEISGLTTGGVNHTEKHLRAGPPPPASLVTAREHGFVGMCVSICMYTSVYL